MHCRKTAILTGQRLFSMTPNTTATTTIPLLHHSLRPHLFRTCMIFPLWKTELPIHIAPSLHNKYMHHDRSWPILLFSRYCNRPIDTLSLRANFQTVFGGVFPSFKRPSPLFRQLSLTGQRTPPTGLSRHALCLGHRCSCSTTNRSLSSRQAISRVHLPCRPSIFLLEWTHATFTRLGDIQHLRAR